MVELLSLANRAVALAKIPQSYTIFRDVRPPRKTTKPLDAATVTIKITVLES